MPENSSISRRRRPMSMSAERDIWWPATAMTYSAPRYWSSSPTAKPPDEASAAVEDGFPLFTESRATFGIVTAVKGPLAGFTRRGNVRGLAGEHRMDGGLRCLDRKRGVSRYVPRDFCRAFCKPVAVHDFEQKACLERGGCVN